MSSRQPLQRNIGDRSLGEMVKRVGLTTALTGVIFPLFLIGILKFTAVEIDGLKPLIGGTPVARMALPALWGAWNSLLSGRG